ncbi:type II toxin-antitoxin system HicA family toxin [Candidatus Protochlamydia amoebophila]|uniref:type II toxin-antitoxin system HicA family toxin n=1 Tax=Candidatus Protochlamydia amoebophila TaxID=362787 RepID=UPI001BC99E70|nr:type II toxin-antitoxin system HicA family toxin [Candidatus Protochlamydia amoebophila]
MSKIEKLIQKILNDQSISYEEAEKLLNRLGFDLNVRGSHHVFRKKEYPKNISIKRRSELLAYQLEDLKEVLKDHGY